MTIFQFEDAAIDEGELAPRIGLAVKCSWCGETIRMDGRELGELCQSCFERVLAEFLRAQQANDPVTSSNGRLD